MKILVVDDEFVALNTLAKFLDEYGSVDKAASAQDALTLFHKAYLNGDYYDLMTIDIEMPVMDGIELLKKINKDEELLFCPPALKVMVTASGTANNVAKAAELDCQAFIVKPIKREILRQKLAEINVE